MPRGAQRDVTTTANLRAAGLLVHPKSFIGKDGHLYFEGEDKSRLRAYVFHVHNSKCAVCGHYAPEEGDEFTAAHWHHPKRCDCPTKECSEVRCNPFTGRDCHTHRKVGFRRTAEAQRRAAEEFNQLYPPGESNP